jgi:hypothetical protein
VGFWEWFNLVATSYVLHRPEGDQPLGYVGYLFRVLEVAAFGAGAFVLTAPLSGTSYCRACGRYRKHKHFATIPAGTFVRAAGEGEAVTEDAIIQGGRAAFDSIATIARAGDAATVLQHVADFPPRRPSEALGSRLDLGLHYCPGCMDAALEGQIIVKKPLTSTVRFLPRVVVPVTFAEPIAEPSRSTTATNAG